MRQWKKLNPDWRHILYTRDTAAEYILENYGSSIAEAFLDIRLPAMMADVFRVARAYAGAGAYVDAATICKAPLSSWLPRKPGLLLLAKPNMDASCYCWNGFIYTQKHRHLFLNYLWRRIALLIMARQGSCVWSDFGPGLYWHALENDQLRKYVTILRSSELMDMLQLSSSSSILPPAQHWSKLQGSLDSLYHGNAKHSFVVRLRKLHASFVLLGQGRPKWVTPE